MFQQQFLHCRAYGNLLRLKLRLPKNACIWTCNRSQVSEHAHRLEDAVAADAENQSDQVKGHRILLLILLSCRVSMLCTLFIYACKFASIVGPSMRCTVVLANIRPFVT